MEIVFGDQVVKLKGIAAQKIKVLKGQQSLKLLKSSAKLCLWPLKQVKTCQDSRLPDLSSETKFYQINVSQESPVSEDNNPLVHKKLKELKKEYKDIFREPDHLPPDRRLFDHMIPLESGAYLVSIRPYRYPLK